ncbi:hypothetical protein B0J12DRAFT_344850 [Macrophomina phaseolina]|uniref:Uncharacterized protein n=1 Tax=Macrophomina phaseolina TaxID=35725 RepID=A0ABQ8GQC8_9PEZI|nr:hypothetical protein B0J12DRAFT_344850 [Macrophomina phaseolina]
MALKQICALKRHPHPKYSHTENSLHLHLTNFYSPALTPPTEKPIPRCYLWGNFSVPYSIQIIPNHHLGWAGRGVRRCVFRKVLAEGREVGGICGAEQERDAGDGSAGRDGMMRLEMSVVDGGDMGGDKRDEVLKQQHNGPTGTPAAKVATVFVLPLEVRPHAGICFSIILVFHSDLPFLLAAIPCRLPQPWCLPVFLPCEPQAKSMLPFMLLIQ